MLPVHCQASSLTVPFRSIQTLNHMHQYRHRVIIVNKTTMADCTFMHAASAACTVLITAFIRFCAFFTSITSACIHTHKIMLNCQSILLFVYTNHSCLLTEASSGVEALTDAIILNCVLRVGISSAQLCRLALVFLSVQSSLITLANLTMA